MRNTDQQAVIDFVAERLPRAQKGIEAANLQQLIVLMCRRQAVLRRIRRDIRLSGWLKIWLYFHIPVTFALLFALIAAHRVDLRLLVMHGSTAARAASRPRRNPRIP